MKSFFECHFRFVLGVFGMLCLFLGVGCANTVPLQNTTGGVDLSRQELDRSIVVELATYLGVEVSPEDTIAQIASNIKMRLVDSECRPPEKISTKVFNGVCGVMPLADAARLRAGQLFLEDVHGKRVFVLSQK